MVVIPTLTHEACPKCAATATFGPVKADGPNSYPYLKNGKKHTQYRSMLRCPNGHRELRMIGRHYEGEPPTWYRQGEGTQTPRTEERRGNICPTHFIERSISGFCGLCD